MSAESFQQFKSAPTIYQSSRPQWDVLVDEDRAAPLIAVIISGDAEALRNLLAKHHLAEIALGEVHTIYSEERCSQGEADLRRVSAMPLLTLARCMMLAVTYDQPDVVRVLLDFANTHNIVCSRVVTRFALRDIIRNNCAEILKVVAASWSYVHNFDGLGHRTLPLYEAVKAGSLEVVVVLLDIGADPHQPVQSGKILGSFNSSLLSKAALFHDSRLIDLLLDHGVSVDRSGALHTAVAAGQLDNALQLLRRGANVNEFVDERTPMHFAAWAGHIDAMELLAAHGGQADAKDHEGCSPAEVLDARMTVAT